MSNRLFQGLVHQMRDTIDATVGVVDDSATIIACSDLTKVGTTNEFVSLDLSDVHDIFIRDGYTYKPFGSPNKPEYAHDHPAEKRVQRLPGADERASAGQAGVACRHLHGVQKPDDDRAAGHTEVHFGQLCQLRGPDRGRDPRGCEGAWRRRV